MTINQLQNHIAAATDVLSLTQKAFAELGIVVNARSATVAPLILGSFDMADAIFTLLLTRPHRCWVACLALQRSQMEYVIRGAFFARAANEKELNDFRNKKGMPTRGDRRIWLSKVVEEAAEHLGWEKDHLLATVTAHQRDLSSVVHGGHEVLAIYTQHEEWGNIDIDWADLDDHIINIMVFLQLGLQVGAALSPLRPKEFDAAMRPAYEAAHTFFATYSATQ